METKRDLVSLALQPSYGCVCELDCYWMWRGEIFNWLIYLHVALLLWPKECWLITLYSCVGLMKYYWRSIHQTHTIIFICFVWVSWHLLVLCWSSVVFSNLFFGFWWENLFCYCNILAYESCWICRIWFTQRIFWFYSFSKRF